MEESSPTQQKTSEYVLSLHICYSISSLAILVVTELLTSHDRHAISNLSLVNVEPNETNTMVAKKSPSPKPDFLNAAFTPGSTKSRKNVVKSPEEDEELFSTFMRWVYEDCQIRNPNPIDDYDASCAAMQKLADLFDFGDRLGVVKLQKQVIKKVFVMLASRHCQAINFPNTILYSIYDLKSLTAKVLKTMIVDYYNWEIVDAHHPPPVFAKLMNDYPDFTRDCKTSRSLISVVEEETGKKLKNPFAGTTCCYVKMFEIWRKLETDALAKTIEEQGQVKVNLWLIPGTDRNSYLEEEDVGGRESRASAS